MQTPTQASEPTTPLAGNSFNGERPVQLKAPPRLPMRQSLPPLLRRDLLQLFRNGAAAGPVVRLDAAGFRLLQVNDELLMREILLDKGRVYRKGRLMRQLGAVTGDGLLINDGDLWRRHRRIANPAMSAGSLPGYLPAMERAAEDTIARWRRQPEGKVLSLLDELSQTTLISLLDSLFGIRFDAKLAHVSAVVHSLLDDIVLRGSALWTAPLSWPTPSNRRFRRRIAEANAILDRIIDTRRRELDATDEPGDLLGQWLNQRDAEADHFDDAEMRDELMTMLIAGHHSLAIALAWAFYHVGRDGELQSALRAEAESMRAASGVDVLDRLPLARGVLLEALRLYPQPPILLREALADHALGDYRIRAGDQIVISVSALHGDAGHWPDPSEFRADRYADFNSDAMMQGHHLGFGGGPRSCIGRRFALLEGVLLLARLIPHFELRLADPDSPPVQPRFAGMLVPSEPLRAILRPL
jgi:cytochrome P450